MTSEQSSPPTNQSESVSRETDVLRAMTTHIRSVDMESHNGPLEEMGVPLDEFEDYVYQLVRPLVDEEGAMGMDDMAALVALATGTGWELHKMREGSDD